MKIKEKISESLSSPERLNEFERRFQIMLPNDYRAFLLNSNGGRPVERKFDFNENGRQAKAAVDWFFGDCDDADYGLHSNFIIYAGRIQPLFLPIATDALGNLVLISCREKDRGKVFFWDHEKENDDMTTTNVFFIANSFSEFIDQLV